MQQCHGSRSWFCLFFIGSGLAHGQAIHVADLRCEYLNDPLGIDAARPRLSWVIESADAGSGRRRTKCSWRQRLRLLEQDRGDLWDSGKVASDETAQIAYGGQPLASRQECYWKVMAWDRDGKPSGWSKPAHWEMGLLKPEDWSAKWIEAGLPAGAETGSLRGAKWIWCPEPGVDLAKTAPAGDRFFRCRVNVPTTEKPSRASILITVDDEYTLFVNGRRDRARQRTGRLEASDELRSPATSQDRREHHRRRGQEPGVAGRRLCEDHDAICRASRRKRSSAIALGKLRPTRTRAGTRSGFDDAKWKNAFEVARFGQGVWKKSRRRRPHSRFLFFANRSSSRDKPIASARLYVTALGLYEMQINGPRVGDHVIAPDWTDYRKRVRYQVYDVTALLKQGDNVIAAALATAGIAATSATAAITSLERRRRCSRSSR